jgi:hypothetical protein
LNFCVDLEDLDFCVDLQNGAFPANIGVEHLIHLVNRKVHRGKNPPLGSIEPLFWYFDAHSDFDILTIYWYFSSPPQQISSTNILT